MSRAASKCRLHAPDEIEAGIYAWSSGSSAKKNICSFNETVLGGIRATTK